MAPTPDGDAARHLATWQHEIESAALYRAIAAAEPQPQLAEVYRKLAETEERHARFWEEKLRAAGTPLPPLRLGWRTRTLVFLARRFGPSLVLPTLDSMEQADRASYDGQPETLGTGLPADEHSHARLLRT